MKQQLRILWMGVFLLILSFTPVLKTHASTPVGHLDGISGNTISGWAWSAQNPEKQVPVRICITNQQTGQIVQELHALASSHRPDLASTGTGNYGFQADIDWEQLEQGTYLIEAYTESGKFPNSLLYLKEGSISTAITSANLKPLGTFKTTAYCPCRRCSAGWGSRTSTGAIATAKRTIAVDPKVIPYGHKVLINGVIYTAEDRGGAVKGKHIDIFQNTHAEALRHGVQRLEVYLIQ